MTVSVSRVNAQEYQEVVNVHNVGFSEQIERYRRFSGIRKLTVEDVERWSTERPLHRKGLVKARVNGVLVAYCSLRGESYRVGHIRRLTHNVADSCSLFCVVPSWRRRGIGNSLLRYAEQFLSSQGFRFAVAWTYKSDLVARAFLEKRDYVHRREFFVEEFSEDLPLNADVEIWRKDLDDRILPKGVTIPPDITLRPARSGDEFHFAEIYNRVWAQYRPEPLSTESARRRIFGPRTDQVFFAEANARPVGCTVVDTTGEISLTGVLPEYRDRGIGTLLLSRTLEYLKRKGRRESYMGTGIPLKGALALYEKLGYEKVEEIHCMVKELDQGFSSLHPGRRVERPST